MKAKVLKPFKYAHDGVNIVDLAVDDEPEIAEGVFAGLEDEGFIKPLSASEGNNGGDGEGDDNHAEDLHIHHTGRGKWAVFDGKNRLTDEPLTKAQAEAKLAEFKAQA